MALRQIILAVTYLMICIIASFILAAIVFAGADPVFGLAFVPFLAMFGLLVWGATDDI